jgi:hypothetical protein
MGGPCPWQQRKPHVIAVGTETADKEIMTMPVRTAGDKE